MICVRPLVRRLLKDGVSTAKDRPVIVVGGIGFGLGPDKIDGVEFNETDLLTKIQNLDKELLQILQMNLAIDTDRAEVGDINARRT